MKIRINQEEIGGDIEKTVTVESEEDIHEVITNLITRGVLKKNCQIDYYDVTNDDLPALWLGTTLVSSAIQ